MEIIEDELGSPVETYFSHLSEEPVAAASFGQVDFLDCVKLLFSRGHVAFISLRAFGYCFLCHLYHLANVPGLQRVYR